jgi:adenylate kinase
MKRLIIVGPPGSGKGTRAKPISKELRIPHLSTGDMLRDQVERGTDLGREVADYQERGVLAPDELVFRVLEARLAQEDCGEGYLLDGFPRNVKQAEYFDRIATIDRGIQVVIDDEEAVGRMMGRAECVPCGKPYNSHSGPIPEVDGKCDDCSGDLKIRTDDTNENVVRNRMKEYHEMTAPLLARYDFISIRGDDPIDVGVRQVFAALK